MSEPPTEGLPEGRELPPEDTEGGRWLSYAELATVRGIGRDSAVKLAQREHWPRQPGNDGTARVLVPLDWLRTARNIPREASPVRDLLAAAEERAERAEQRADRAEGRAEREEKRADQTWSLMERLMSERDEIRHERDRAQARADQAEGRADDALAQAREARKAADELRQAEAERQGRGRWARLRAAWRGE